MKEENLAMLFLLRSMYDILSAGQEDSPLRALQTAHRSAAKHSAHQNETLTSAAFRLETYMGAKLQPYGTYSGWLYNNSQEYRALGEKERGEAAQQGRLAWVSHMMALVKA